MALLLHKGLEEAAQLLGAWGPLPSQQPPHSLQAFLLQILLLLPEKSLKSRKGILITAALSIVAPIFIYQLFYRAFSIFLPAGLLG